MPALAEFDEVLRQGGRDAGIFCAKGLVLLEMGQCWQAVCALHEALAVGPQDPVATDLLSRALEENAARQGWSVDEEDGEQEEDELEIILRRNKEEVVMRGDGRRMRRAREIISEEGGLGNGRASEGMVEDSMMVMSDGDE